MYFVLNQEIMINIFLHYNYKNIEQAKKIKEYFYNSETVTEYDLSI